MLNSFNLGAQLPSGILDIIEKTLKTQTQRWDPKMAAPNFYNLRLVNFVSRFLAYRDTGKAIMTIDKL